MQDTIPRQSGQQEAVNNRQRLLELLADGQFHSGQDLGRTLSVSRAAVWKILHSLADCGLSIISVRGRGYCLERPLEFFSRAYLLEHIDQKALDAITTLSLLNEVDSTNQFLLDRIDQPDFHGHVVLAEYQSAGRGRYSNQWLSPFASGIYLSLGWEFTSPPAAMGVLSLALGVAVIDTLEYFDVESAGLKWPNDILHDLKKLGGILVEMRAESAGSCQAVIGIGLNYALPQSWVKIIDQPVTDIAAIADPLPKRNAVVAELITRSIEVLQRCNVARIGDYLDRWREHDCIIGKNVTIHTPVESIAGQVMGIDESGSLLLQSGDEVITFTSGDVSLHLQ